MEKFGLYTESFGLYTEGFGLYTEKFSTNFVFQIRGLLSSWHEGFDRKAGKNGMVRGVSNG